MRRYDTNHFGAKSKQKRIQRLLEHAMRDEYNFQSGVRNPYLKNIRKSVTIRLDDEVIVYFKNLAVEKGVPYQSLINLYLKDCVQQCREPRSGLITANVSRIRPYNLHGTNRQRMGNSITPHTRTAEEPEGRAALARQPIGAGGHSMGPSQWRPMEGFTIRVSILSNLPSSLSAVAKG